METEEETNISVTTIARIFREIGFKNADTLIMLSTLKLSAEYIRLFVNEAIIRANEERILEGDSLSKVDGIDNVESASDANIEVDAEAEDEIIEDDDIDDLDPEDIQDSDTQRQLKVAETNNNDTLDSRHLQKIAGVLILDF